MNYIEPDMYLNGPAYTWTSSPEPYSSSYRMSVNIPPIPTYEPCSLIHDSLDLSTTIAQSPPVSSESPYIPLGPNNMIDMTPSPSFSPALLEQQTRANTDEKFSSRGSFKAARRLLRRPIPVAVPNLTKKARGRQVPTKDTLLKSGSGRAYACPVDNCRKVFTRSEHLKRHTRSIHTNEKPFKCEEPHCGRLFTRRDNLLQHLKNNRHFIGCDDELDIGPLDRVRPTQQSADYAAAYCESPPTMGILVPPSSPTTPLSYNPLPMNDLEGATSYDALCCGVGEAPSPNSTPDPSESSYVVYDFGYAWPQSDIRSVPHSFGAQSMEATCSRMTAGLVGGYTIHG